jgi:translation initiation factor 1
MTIVEGLALDPAKLDELATQLKKACGTGGTVAGATIELQGDQRERLEAELTRRGYRVKRAGG